MHSGTRNSLIELQHLGREGQEGGDRREGTGGRGRGGEGEDRREGEGRTGGRTGEGKTGEWEEKGGGTELRYDRKEERAVKRCNFHIHIHESHSHVPAMITSEAQP